MAAHIRMAFTPDVTAGVAAPVGGLSRPHGLDVLRVAMRATTPDTGLIVHESLRARSDQAAERGLLGWGSRWLPSAEWYLSTATGRLRPARVRTSRTTASGRRSAHRPLGRFRRYHTKGDRAARQPSCGPQLQAAVPQPFSGSVAPSFAFAAVLCRCVRPTIRSLPRRSTLGFGSVPDVETLQAAQIQDAVSGAARRSAREAGLMSPFDPRPTPAVRDDSPP
jgi:hypothetical protein